MAVATVLEFAGMTRDAYERVGGMLPGGAPDGILYHACGPVDGGWRIMDVWESREAFDRFADETYLPAVKRAGDHELVRREVVITHHAGAVVR
jgi:hypothetical protein